MGEIEPNMQKYENYKEQFKRLDKAMKQGFLLEALFIEYAILEDRTESILRYEGNSINSNRHISIDRKLKKIKTISREKDSLPNRYFQDDFIDRILDWKEKRNKLIHKLMDQVLTTDELLELAEEGKELARLLSNRANNYKRAVERKKRPKMQAQLKKDGK